MLKLDPAARGTDKGWIYGTLTPDGRQVSTVSLDGTAYLWDAHTGRVLSATRTNLEPVAPHGFTVDGRARTKNGSANGPACARP